MSLPAVLILSILLFSIGLYGVMVRRHLIGMLICIELMLNAANLNFIAFAFFGSPHPTAGAVFTVFVIAVTACEMAVALAIVVALHRRQHSLDADAMRSLKG